MSKNSFQRSSVLEEEEDADEPVTIDKIYINKTYGFAAGLLILSMIILFGLIQWTALGLFLNAYYYLILLSFFVGFIILQLYVFFFSLLDNRKVLRIIALIVAYVCCTICIMKPIMIAPNISVGVAVISTLIILGIAAGGGAPLASAMSDVNLPRAALFMWSQRAYGMMCFGILVATEMYDMWIVFASFVVYTLIGTAFVFIFAAAVCGPDFFNLDSPRDFMLVGHLFYCNFLTLFISYAWLVSYVIIVFFPENALNLV